MANDDPNKPTLQEIANMPISQSVVAMRCWYDSDWGKPQPENMRRFRVKFDYSYTVEASFDEVVEAEDAKSAEDIAEEEIVDDYGHDVEIGIMSVEEVD